MRTLRPLRALLLAGCAALALSAPCASTCAAQEGPGGGADELLAPALRDLFHEALSGELAKEHVIAITRHHRIQGSRGYRQAAHYVLGQLAGFGYATPPAGADPEAEAATGTAAATAAATAAGTGTQIEAATRAAAGTAAGGTPGSCRATDPPSAWIESFVSDGRAVYQTWQSPSGWDIESAELRLLPPRGAAGASRATAAGATPDPAGTALTGATAAPAAAGERIVGFPEIAMSVMTYSNAGDVTAPCVWVGSGEREEDYAGKDVRGKFVLATGYGGAVHRLAVLGHGAAAVVCFLDDGRAADHPDMLQYTGMWPRADELERTTFGFNLTHRQGSRLRDMLLAGQDVTLHGWVKGRGLEPYFMDVVCAVIPGSEHPEEELVFSAHLDHPKESANDNASGSGAILDMARTLKELIDSGRLPRPQRTLRFLWVPEWNGTMAYIDRHPELCGPELGGKVLANLNMDMVGENLELLHSRLILTRTPDSLPSCLNDVVQNMAEMVDGMDIRTPRGGASAFNWRMTPYSGGSDHMMMLDRKIPAIMFSHSPDYTHHTSDDTPDKVDPVELERCELIATGAAWFLANLDIAQGLDLAQLVAARGASDYGQAVRRATASGIGTADRLALAREWQQTAVKSVAWWLRSVPGDRMPVHECADRLLAALVDLYGPGAGVESAGPQLTALAHAVTGTTAPRIPVRLTRGPLDFGLPENGLSIEDRKTFQAAVPAFSGDVRFELVNFIDGRRTIRQIADMLSMEFAVEIPVTQVEAYLDALETIGVVKAEPAH
ncbi:MAG TPA: DUF4910 domain-containing protein [Planctomycetota bacterium]|nr:DUF4910 domain-containing protein [Planctomycetota bacterium]